MFEELARTTPEISVDSRYWLVRTDGGTLYEAFIATNSIAYGYDLIDIEFISQLSEDNEDAKDELKTKLRTYYPPKERDDGGTTDLSGLQASQILRFSREMKRGDIVIIPSGQTHRLGFGFIDDDGPYEEELKHHNETFKGFNKRRKVRWLRGLDRAKINPNLLRLFFTQQTIVDATDYSEWIDPLLYDFFRKGEEFHLVVRVETTENIKAQSLFRVCLNLFDLAEEFASADGGQIQTRINLNSPGSIELFANGVLMIGAVAVLIVGINGGGFEMSLKKGTDKISLKTEGLIKRIIEFLNERERRKNVEEIRRQLKDLKITDPKQIIELLKEIKK